MKFIFGLRNQLRYFHHTLMKYAVFVWYFDKRDTFDKSNDIPMKDVLSMMFFAVKA